jgi:hypothetical protein
VLLAGRMVAVYLPDAVAGTQFGVGTVRDCGMDSHGDTDSYLVDWMHQDSKAFSAWPGEQLSSWVPRESIISQFAALISSKLPSAVDQAVRETLSARRAAASGGAGLGSGAGSGSGSSALAAAAADGGAGSGSGSRKSASGPRSEVKTAARALSAAPAASAAAASAAGPVVTRPRALRASTQATTSASERRALASAAAATSVPVAKSEVVGD